MRFKRIISLGISVIMVISSVNAVFADENTDIMLSENTEIISDEGMNISLDENEKETDANENIEEQSQKEIIQSNNDVSENLENIQNSEVETESHISKDNTEPNDGDIELTAVDEAWFAYKVTGGNIYYDPNTGIIKSADTGVTSVIIPSEIDGVEITQIASSAFRGCVSLTNVSIPRTIESVGSNAFQNCTSLNYVTFGENTTNAFTMSIGDYAFDGCTNLTNIELPHQLTRLGYCFIRGTSVETITIPNKVTSSGESSYNGALAGCNSLSKVIFENGITAIPNYIMASDDYTSYIKEVIIPDSVTNIGNSAFYKCTSLPNVNIPDNVTNIGGNAFSNCTGLSNMNIPNNVTNIGGYAFSNCTGLSSINIANSVSKIEGGAFSGCKKLTNIKFNENIANAFTMSIGDYAFDDCTSLTNIELPHQLTRLGYCFIRGTSVETITIPNKVTSSGESSYNGALAGCNSLSKVIFENGITAIPNYIMASDDYTNYVKEVVIPDSVTNIGNYTFYKCNNITILCRPNSYAESYAIANNIPYIHIDGSGQTGSDGSKLNFSNGLYNIALNRVESVSDLMLSISPLTDNISDLTFTSSNQEVADVKTVSRGIDSFKETNLWVVLDLKSAGSTTITATNSKGATASCIVMVKSASASVPKSSYGTTNRVKENSTSKEEQLKNAVEAYNTALSVYEQNVASALQKVQVSEPNEDKVIKSMESELTSMMVGIIPNDAKDSCRKALYYTIKDMSYTKTALDKIDFSKDEITISTNLVKQISKALVNENKTYDLNKYKVTVCITGYNGAFTGSLTCTPKKGGFPITIMVNSTLEKTANVMEDYLNQIRIMETNALNQALIATIDFFNEQVGIDKYIKSKFTKIIDKHAPALNNLGLGEVVTFVNDCKNCGNDVKKVLKVKNEDYEAVYKEIKNLSNLPSLESSKISTTLTNKAYKNLQTCRNNLITAATNYIYNTPEKENFWDKYFSWKCPVDIIVYDENGNEIGSIIGDEIECNSDDIVLKKTGDLKEIYTLNGIEISYKMIATDYGLLNITVKDYVDNNILGRQNFYDIPLDLGDEFTTSSVSDKIEKMIVYTPDGEKVDDEYISITNDACININVISAENGSVVNAGEYAKGDAVTLIATPNDGYKFSGWYDNDNFLISSMTYNFTAKEDLNLIAKFTEMPISLSEPVITVDDLKPENGKKVNVDIETDEDNAKIYYTTDGREPTVNSNKYTEPFSISGNDEIITIKAIAVIGDNVSDTVIKEIEFSKYDISNIEIGDVDGKRGISVNDASCVLQKVLDRSFKLPIEEKTDNYMKYADVDGNRVLTAADAAIILQKALNKDFIFPVKVKK